MVNLISTPFLNMPKFSSPRIESKEESGVKRWDTSSLILTPRSIALKTSGSKLAIMDMPKAGGIKHNDFFYLAINRNGKLPDFRLSYGSRPENLILLLLNRNVFKNLFCLFNRAFSSFDISFCLKFSLLKKGI